MTNDNPFPPGIYEHLLTVALRQQVPEGRSELRDLEDDEHALLTRHVAQALERALRVSRLDVTERVTLCNQILRQIASFGPPDAVMAGDYIPSPAELLTAIYPPAHTLSRPPRFPRPEISVSEDALLVHAPHEPSLAAELRAELLSADRVDPFLTLRISVPQYK